MSDKIYSWTFEDNKNRWALWYTIALSLVIWLTIWWFFTQQYWMSFIVLLIAWLFYFVENNSEDTVEVQVKELWLNIAWVFYNFENIDSFWIVYKWEEPFLLRLNLNKKWLKNIDVKINSKIVNEVKSVLSDFIEETPKIELSFSEKFIKLLKL